MSKRAERRNRTQKVVNKRIPFVKDMYRTGPEIPASRVGKCKKNHPHDCGHKQCYCCHSDKIDKIPTPQELRSNYELKDYLEE